jgi:myosin-crossreactive antigen
MRQRGGELENYYEEGDENYDGVVLFYDKDGKIERRGRMYENDFKSLFNDDYQNNPSHSVTKESEWYNVVYYIDNKRPDKTKYLIYIHNEYISK